VKIEWLKTTRGMVTGALVGTVAVLALGVGIGAAAGAPPPSHGSAAALTFQATAG
jgi:hypothetical protein